MPTFIYSRTAGRMVEVVRGPRRPSVFPNIMRDTPEYVSPITHRPVDGRAARREDLKRAECREVDPSEWRPVAHDPAQAVRYGLTHEPPPPTPEYVADWQANRGIVRAEAEQL